MADQFITPVPNAVSTLSGMGGVINGQNPNYIYSIMQAQRQQQMAQLLTQQSVQPIDYDNRGAISPWQGAAKLMAAYLGAAGSRNANQQMAQVIAQGNKNEANAYHLNDGNQPLPQQPPDFNNPASQALGMGAQQGSVGPTNSNAVRMADVLMQNAPGQALEQGSVEQPSQPGADGQPVNQGGVGPTNDNAARMAALLQQGSAGAVAPPVQGPSPGGGVPPQALAAGLLRFGIDGNGEGTGVGVGASSNSGSWQAPSQSQQPATDGANMGGSAPTLFNPQGGASGPAPTSGPDTNAEPAASGMGSLPAGHVSPLNPLGAPDMLVYAAAKNVPGAKEMLEQWMRNNAPTDFGKDLNLLPPDQRSGAVTNKFFPPIVGRDGAPVFVRQPDGSLKVDPASADAVAAIGNAKAPFGAMRTIKASDGSEVQLSEPEYQEWEKSGNLPPRLVPPKVTQAAQDGANSTGATTVASTSIPGVGKASASIAPTIGMGQSTFDRELNTNQAKDASDMITEVNKNGAAAVQKIATNQKMLSLLPTITTGPAADRITAFKNLASSMGVDLGDPAPNQEFGKYAFQGAMQAGKQIYGSKITNADLQALITNSPGTSMEEKASRALIQFDNELQARNIQKMTALQDYQKSGGDMHYFSPWFEQNFPYHGVAAPQPGQSQQGVNIPPVAPTQPALPGNPAVDYQQRYGIKLKK